MTFKEIQEKLKKCELALTSIKDGSYSSTKYNSKEEAIEKLSTLKESLEKKLNLLKETTVIDPTTPPSDAASIAKETGKKIQTVQKAIDTAKKGKEAVNIAEDEYEAEDETISTSHISLISKEIHKALIDALQDTGHEVSEDRISSLNPQTFTIEVKFKDNTQSDYSFEVSNREVKIEGNIVVNTNKKGVSPVLNKEIAKDNLVKYIKNLSEELDPVGEEDDDINNDGNVDDTDKYLKKRRDAISKNIKEEETEFEVDSTGKPTGNLKLKLSDKDKETLKKIEALLAKEKNETKGAPKGHYFTKSGNLVKGRLTKDARERGARLSDPKDKQRSKVPPVTQYNEGEGDDHHYIKVPRREYKKAMSILDGASDGNFVKMDFVDDDGAGNVIIYFEFSDGYIASGQADAYMYDAVSDLQAQDVTISDHSAELDEALDINDPALMAARVAKMRADDMKKLDAYKKSPEGRAAARAYASGQRKEEKAREIVRKLKIKRAQVMSDMENDPDIEPQGGPVADMYGDQLNKIDNAIEKAASVYNKPMDYDTAVGKVTEGNEEAITYFQQAIKLSHTNKVRNLILKAAKELGLEIPKVWTETVNVGDILTKDGKKGKVVKVMDDMANVDFGNGDVYGITFGRIKGKEIVNEEEEGHLVTFGYDLDRIEDVVKHLQSKYKEGQDFELHIGRGDDLPNAVTLKNPALEKDHDLNDMLNAAQSDQDRYDAYTDYDQRRREEDDYYEDPDYYKESKLSLAESLLDDLKEEEEPEPEEEGDEEAPKDTVLEDATDQILAKFPTLTAAIIKLQTEDFKEFVDSIDWISPRPTEFRINLKNGQDYIMKWTGTGFEAQIMGKRFYIDKITDYQQALDKLAILYKEGPMTGAGEGEPADVDSGGSSGGGGGDFPGDDAGGGGGDDVDALGADDAGADDAGGADLTGEPVDFEEPAEEPEA